MVPLFISFSKVTSGQNGTKVSGTEWGFICSNVILCDNSEAISPETLLLAFFFILNVIGRTLTLSKVKSLTPPLRQNYDKTVSRRKLKLSEFYYRLAGHNLKCMLLHQTSSVIMTTKLLMGLHTFLAPLCLDLPNTSKQLLWIILNFNFNVRFDFQSKLSPKNDPVSNFSKIGE